MKFKVLILLFLCSELVDSIPYYEAQPTSHLGEYPIQSSSQEGITSEQWPSNLARSQNTNLRSGPEFGELPSNNYQSILGNNRPLEAPNYNYHHQNRFSQAPVTGESYTNPISESYLPVQQENYENIHTATQHRLNAVHGTIHPTRAGNIEPFQTHNFVPPHSQNYENLENVRESYETPARTENLGNRRTIQESIQNSRTRVEAVPHLYNNENLHNIRAVPKETYKIENIESVSPITYESIRNEENLNQKQELYRHNDPRHRVPTPQESYAVPLHHTYQNLPEVERLNIPEEPLKYNLFNNEEHYIHQLNLNPKIKEIIQSTKNKKRFMVIHNDGTVEHTDILSPAVTTNPNYVMISGGKVVPREILPAIIGPSPSFPPGSKPTVAPKIADSAEPLLPVEEGKPLHSSATKSSTPAIAPSPTLLLPTNEPETEKSPISTNEDLLKLNDEGLNQPNSTQPTPTPIETVKELLNKIGNSTNLGNKPSKHNLPTDPVEKPLDETSNKKPHNEPSNSKINNNPDNKNSNQPAAINPIDTTLNETKESNNNTTKPTIKNKNDANSNPSKIPPSTPSDDKKNETVSFSIDQTEPVIPSPEEEEEEEDEEDVGVSIPDKKINLTKSTPPTKQPYDDNKTKDKESPYDQPENKSTKYPDGAKKAPKPAVNENEDAENDDEDEEEKPKVKTPKQIATAKPDKNGDYGEIVTKDFVRKMAFANNNPDKLYIFFVQDQPLIEREVNRTLYPNGTIFEEITEVTNERTDKNRDEEKDHISKPKTKKTVKTINA